MAAKPGMYRTFLLTGSATQSVVCRKFVESISLSDFCAETLSNETWKIRGPAPIGRIFIWEFLPQSASLHFLVRKVNSVFSKNEIGVVSVIDIEGVAEILEKAIPKGFSDNIESEKNLILCFSQLS